MDPIIPSFPRPRITIPTHNLNPAKWAYERLVLYIRAFEKELDEEHEVGARLVSFGSEVIFNIDSIGYHGPDIISFSGTSKDGLPLQLIQHISQLSVLLVAMKKAGEKAKRIGFQLTIDKEDGEDEE